MSNNPVVSICIPVHNAEQHIAESLNSILQQSYHPIEIIVVNDGSTDRTSEILGTYKKKGIKIIEQENKGQCAAANRAYAESKGEYIKFFDADDILSQDFIKNQVAVLAGRSDAIASAAWGRFYNEDINTFKLNSERVWKDMKPIDWLVESMIDGPNMMQCALWLIPRKILKNTGLWDERLSLINDFEFFIRVLLDAQEIKFTPDATLYYRSGLVNSLSGQKSRTAYESAYLSTQLGVQHLLNFENSERVKQICAINMCIWQYEFYPIHKDLYKKTKNWIKELGGSDFPFPAGGYTKLLCTLLGWKTTKIIKVAISRIQKKTDLYKIITINI